MLVKYWEKKDNPNSNPSVSFTLNNCKTINCKTLKKIFRLRNTDSDSFVWHFEGQKRRFQTEDSKILEKLSLSHFESIILQLIPRILSVLA
jgi:hypothetical protein